MVGYSKGVHAIIVCMCELSKKNYGSIPMMHFYTTIAFRMHVRMSQEY